MASGIYIIKNTINNKIYIGSAKNISSRFSAHRNELRKGRHPNAHLQKSWNKYGEACFDFSVIEYVDDVCLLVEREQAYIDDLCPEYNKRKIANSNLGIKFSEEHNKNISDALIGHPFWGNRKSSDETKKKLSLLLIGNSHTLGHTLTEEHKKKIGESSKGHKHTEEAKVKMANASRGRKMSEEIKRKLSIANTGRKHTEEAKNKIVQALVGRPVSEETRNKISNSLMGHKCFGKKKEDEQ